MGIAGAQSGLSRSEVLNLAGLFAAASAPELACIAHLRGYGTGRDGTQLGFFKLMSGGTQECLFYSLSMSGIAEAKISD